MAEKCLETFLTDREISTMEGATLIAFGRERDSISKTAGVGS